MAEIARRTKRFPTDLTDEEGDRIAPLMPKLGRRGRPRENAFREVINALRDPVYLTMLSLRRQFLMSIWASRSGCHDHALATIISE